MYIVFAKAEMYSAMNRPISGLGSEVPEHECEVKARKPTAKCKRGEQD